MSNVDQIDAVTVNIHNRINPNKHGKQQEQEQQQNDLSNEIKSKKPKNTALKQQRLPAWQPILTASTVLPLFFTIGVVFIVIGSVLLHYSDIVNEYIYDYTSCVGANNIPCSVNTSVSNPCYCTYTFALGNSFSAPVYMYYGLQNFYQNHRRYVKSRDDNQLLGNKVTTSSISSDCAPYGASDNLTYAPAGAIANSLFNDTFVLTYNGPNNNTNISVVLIPTGIAWTSDKDVKFGTVTNWNGTVQPKNWNKTAANLDPTDPSNTGYKNEDFIVWMRTAALPNFRKFYRRIDHTQSNFTTSLPSGYYTLKIEYNYPVTVFDGKKSFILSTSTWLGGKNPFLGIAYLVIGCLSVVLGIVFLIIHLMFGKRINEEYNVLKNISQISQ